jgi:hypothetical protein
MHQEIIERWPEDRPALKGWTLYRWLRAAT